jgi:hypothetical protein
VVLATTTFADPIHDAARTGDLAGVQAELNKGVNVNAKDRIGGKTTARMGEIKDQYLV